MSTTIPQVYKPTVKSEDVENARADAARLKDQSKRAVVERMEKFVIRYNNAIPATDGELFSAVAEGYLTARDLMAAGSPIPAPVMAAVFLSTYQLVKLAREDVKQREARGLTRTAQALNSEPGKLKLLTKAKQSLKREAAKPEDKREPLAAESLAAVQKQIETTVQANAERRATTKSVEPPAHQVTGARESRPEVSTALDNAAAPPSLDKRECELFNALQHGIRRYKRELAAYAPSSRRARQLSSQIESCRASLTKLIAAHK
jgi:hypothetical protein